MAWVNDVMVDGFDTILYAQAAGTVGAPSASDEVPFATAFSWNSEKETTERGPWMNLATKKKTQGGASNSGELSIDMSKAVQAVRALLIAAGIGTSRIKFTLMIGGTNGDKRVWDQCILNEGGEVNPAEGVSLTLSWQADTYVYTAGSYA